MKSRIYRFESEDIVVSWDYARCIHVEACIRALPVVFNRDRRPWIDPSLATADKVVAACEACPTGALHYERLDGGAADKTPGHNTITVSSDGPLFAKGNLTITNEAGEIILKDTRAALCRCGHSRNKPLCDGSHSKAKFTAESTLTPAALERDDGDEPESCSLTIRVSDPGPLMIRGSAELASDGSSDSLLLRQV